ncbi:hypothetical protein EYF80_059405 [Liparis tanakae]|uniref:Uncharacterized protein n=1 Tax=Liparis tanakae TaxID=230148 RepID=A0A4Z2EPW9_9TELE|nr:hypothetical protein EYF80_059405 [Liparis tanakae]
MVTLIGPRLINRVQFEPTIKVEKIEKTKLSVENATAEQFDWQPSDLGALCGDESRRAGLLRPPPVSLVTSCLLAASRRDAAGHESVPPSE